MSYSMNEKVECLICKAQRVCILIQVCVPIEDSEDNEHEKLDDLFVCRSCIRRQGQLGKVVAEIVRHDS